MKYDCKKHQSLLRGDTQPRPEEMSNLECRRKAELLGAWKKYCDKQLNNDPINIGIPYINYLKY